MKVYIEIGKTSKETTAEVAKSVKLEKKKV